MSSIEHIRMPYCLLLKLHMLNACTSGVN